MGVGSADHWAGDRFQAPIWGICMTLATNNFRSSELDHCVAVLRAVRTPTMEKLDEVLGLGNRNCWHTNLPLKRI